MSWILSTATKKNVTQVETWVRGDQTIRRTIGWRWGSVVYDEKPDIDLTESSEHFDEGILVYDIGDVVDVTLDDGCWEEMEFSDSITEEQRTEIETLFNDGEDYTMEDEGWIYDSSLVFHGELELEESN